MRRRLFLKPVTAALLAGALVASPPAADPAAATTRPERKMYGMINRERLRRSIHRLRLSQYLSRVARRHSRKMARDGQVYHSRCLSCRMRSSWNRLGENVGAGGTIRRVHRAFMHNSDHRSNILGRYRKVGVGIARGRGRVWVTEIFYA